MDTSVALRTRRTIHDYTKRALPEGALERALQCALRAPNHKITNPWRFTLLGPLARAKIIELGLALKQRDRVLKEEACAAIRAKLGNPPVLLVVSQVRVQDAFRAREDYAAIACAIQNLSLSLWSEGIGSKWSSGKITYHEDTYTISHVDPEKEEIVGFVWAGYATTTPNPPRLPLEHVLRHTP